jgi:hypothetical protein
MLTRTFPRRRGRGVTLVASRLLALACASPVQGFSLRRTVGLHCRRARWVSVQDRRRPIQRGEEQRDKCAVRWAHCGRSARGAERRRALGGLAGRSDLPQGRLLEPAPRAARHRGAAMRGVLPRGESEGCARAGRGGGSGPPGALPQIQARAGRPARREAPRARSARGTGWRGLAWGPSEEAPAAERQSGFGSWRAALHQRGAPRRGEAALRARPFAAGRGRDAARPDPLRERQQRRGRAALPVQAPRLAAPYARQGAARAAPALGRRPAPRNPGSSSQRPTSPAPETGPGGGTAPLGRGDCASDVRGPFLCPNAIRLYDYIAMQTGADVAGSPLQSMNGGRCPH